jgi:hypothetical protein
VRVLDNEKLVGYQSLFAIVDEPLLEFESGLVGHVAEVAELASSEYRREGGLRRRRRLRACPTYSARH